MKKILIVGVAGKIGSMFAFELKNYAEILGIDLKEKIEEIKEGKILIKRSKEKTTLFQNKILFKDSFDENFSPDFIFLCTKNPVREVVKYYYQKFQNKTEIPALILPQNGISVIEEAKEELEKIFAKKTEKIRIIRVCLFNPVSSKTLNEKIIHNYSLPIRLAFGVASGPQKTEDIKEIFQNSNIETTEVLFSEIKNMEYSKLFLNLIGMASAVRGLTIKEGFQKKEILKEEIGALKEYVKVVKMSGGKFLNFPHYPVKFFAFFVDLLPSFIFLIFRKFFEAIIQEKRGDKPKEIDEIKYYNGAVVELGNKKNFFTPINKDILKRGLEALNKSGRVRI